MSRKDEFSIDFEDLENIVFLLFFDVFFEGFDRSKPLAWCGSFAGPLAAFSDVAPALRQGADCGKVEIGNEGFKTNAEGGKPP